MSDLANVFNTSNDSAIVKFRKFIYKMATNPKYVDFSQEMYLKWHETAQRKGAVESALIMLKYAKVLKFRHIGREISKSTVPEGYTFFVRNRKYKDSTKYTFPEFRKKLDSVVDLLGRQKHVSSLRRFIICYAKQLDRGIFDKAELCKVISAELGITKQGYSFCFLRMKKLLTNN